MLLGVVGLNGSGKEVVARYLVSRHGFAFRDIGQEIRDGLKAAGRDYLDRDEMVVLGNEMRKKFGNNYWCKMAIDSEKSKDVVVTSIRNPGEVREITSRGGVILEVFANQRTRFQRTVARVRENASAHGDTQSFEQFKGKEERELKNDDPSKQQMLECIAAAKYRLDNNGTIEQLYARIEELLAKMKAG